MMDTPESAEPIRKKVDEDWKAQVERERRTSGANPRPAPSAQREASASQRGGQPPPSMDFSTFVSSLAMQALVALGELPTPGTHQARLDLEQARYLIDLLGVLEAKTRGNLTPEESSLLENQLYDLRMKYVTKTTQ